MYVITCLLCFVFVQLVNTIEKLSPVLTPDVKTMTAVKKTVRLSVPQEGLH